MRPCSVFLTWGKRLSSVIPGRGNLTIRMEVPRSSISLLIVPMSKGLLSLGKKNLSSYPSRYSLQTCMNNAKESVERAEATFLFGSTGS